VGEEKQFTVTIPDALILEALTAADSINNRQRAEDRQPYPGLVFTDVEVTEIVRQWLHNIIISDLGQRQQIEVAQQVRDKQKQLSDLQVK